MNRARGKSLLRITGILELLFGATMLALTLYVMSLDESSIIKILGKDPNLMTFVQLACVYAQAGVQIIAGIVGIMFANSIKHHKICMFFGYLLILICAANFIHIEYNVQTIATQSLSLIVPVFYLLGAIKNKNS